MFEFENIRSWKRGELDYVERNMSHKSYEEMATFLNRPPLSVKRQIAKIKVKLNNRKRGANEHEKGIGRN